MTPKPEIFRYVTELDTLVGTTPTVDDGTRFQYDSFQHGTPTTAKLARVAAQIEAHEHADEDLYSRWAGKRLRFWLWRDDGESYGSIEVALDFEPLVTPIGDTLKRTAEAA